MVECNGVEKFCMTEPKTVSYGRRISDLAAAHPDKVAIVFVSHPNGREQSLTWSELDRRSNQSARVLADLGVATESTIVIGLPNGEHHIVAAIAAWKVGAMVLPLYPRMPESERSRILKLANPTVIIADWETDVGDLLRSAELDRAMIGMSDAPVPDVIAHPGKAVGSGGSTGLPKIIVDPNPWVFTPDTNHLFALVGWTGGMVQLVAGPLYHSAPLFITFSGLAEAQTLVVMERFDAAPAVDLIERHRVNCAFLAPTMMRRIAELAGIDGRDFSSIRSIYHTAAPCSPVLKQRWIDLIGPEQLYDAYGGAENVGIVTIRGDDWIVHRGSSGLPRNADLKILDEEGNELPCGEIGEIFMRRRDAEPPYYRYIGSENLKSTPDGFSSLGDLGCVDAEGYLYLADRRVDMIVSGGENIYPAEIEGVLCEHAKVGDCAVIGLTDDDWGKRVHAVVEPVSSADPPSDEDLDRHCRGQLAPYKVPKSFEVVDALPRQPSGKIRRSALVEARCPTLRRGSGTATGAVS